MNKSIPRIIKPQLATSLDKIPSGKEWIHEIKFDGYRMLCLIKNRSIHFITRNGKSWESKLPSLVKQLNTFPRKNTIVDGEIVVLNKKGISQFQLLQNAIKAENDRDIIYYVFDIPYLDGENLCDSPLLSRKKTLNTLFKMWKKTDHPKVLISEYIKGMGETLYKEARRHGLEGIISKKVDSRYLQKRTEAWLKSKCKRSQELVIGGFTKPRGTRQYFGALLLGFYDNHQNFIYCGKAGTGFSEATLKELYDTLKPLITLCSPFEKNSKIEDLEYTIWVKPKLVAQFAFSEWTQNGRLRHPSFLGLRLDKNPKEVIKE